MFYSWLADAHVKCLDEPEDARTVPESLSSGADVSAFHDEFADLEAGLSDVAARLTALAPMFDTVRQAWKSTSIGSPSTVSSTVDASGIAAAVHAQLACVDVSVDVRSPCFKDLPVIITQFTGEMPQAVETSTDFMCSNLAEAQAAAGAELANLLAPFIELGVFDVFNAPAAGPK